mmetsp:Transcript_11990/g.26449  ORF Transcript_11990/g.26449 Transcript_11990/m.26449 type:complete len:204 (-) Transcript_11990:94-705(-)
MSTSSTSSFINFLDALAFTFSGSSLQLHNGPCIQPQTSGPPRCAKLRFISEANSRELLRPNIQLPRPWKPAKINHLPLPSLVRCNSSTSRRKIWKPGGSGARSLKIHEISAGSAGRAASLVLSISPISISSFGASTTLGAVSGAGTGSDGANSMVSLRLGTTNSAEFSCHTGFSHSTSSPKKPAATSKPKQQRRIMQPSKSCQ